jgi:hypothetical protein
VWCCSCGRGYSLYSYVDKAGISLKEFLTLDFEFTEAVNNEVRKMEFPKSFLSLSNTLSQPGLDYLKSRNIQPVGDIYYDIKRNGIVFTYFFQNVFVGAQIRLIEPKKHDDGSTQKIDTLPGTRLGLIFYNYNQTAFLQDIKYVIVTEGAFNTLAIQQSLLKKYKSILNCPYVVMACSGSGSSQHHIDIVKSFKDRGIKTILAFDTDEAGLKGLKKFATAKAITHYSLTQDTEKDWNDILIEKGEEGVIKTLFTNLKPVE